MIKILVLILSVHCFSMEPKIGNYSQWIPGYDKCGLSKNTVRIKTPCFESKNVFNPGLVNARNVNNGEAPWTVFIKIFKNVPFWQRKSPYGYCGGSLIHPRWVITAAHCIINDPAKLEIYFDLKKPGSGKFIKSAKLVPHPLYNDNPVRKWDIGLVKLDQDFDVDEQDDSFYCNSICLPDKRLDPQGSFQVLMAGFGPYEDHLQIAPLIASRKSDEVLMIQSTHGNNTLCSGDSGAPLWRYDMGRAYLISIHLASYRVVPDKCSYGGDSNLVNNHIDWIIETIQNE